MFEKAKERFEVWKKKMQEEKELKEREEKTYEESYEQSRVEARMKAAKEAGERRAFQEARARYMPQEKRQHVYNPYGGGGRLQTVRKTILAIGRAGRKMPIVQQMYGLPPVKKAKPSHKRQHKPKHKPKRRAYNPFDMTTWY